MWIPITDKQKQTDKTELKLHISYSPSKPLADTADMVNKKA